MPLWEEEGAATEMNQRCSLSSSKFMDSSITYSFERLQYPSEQERVRLGCSEEGS